MSEGKPIINVTRGTVVCEDAVLADRPLQRMRGLLRRDDLPAREGMLLHPAPSIHTAFMHFPIDVVFLDRESVVVRVVEHLLPWRAASAHGARSALELRAGEAARRGVSVGDWLVRVSEDLICEDLVGDHVLRELDRGPRDVPRSGKPSLELPRRLPAESGGARRELLLVSRDRRFRAVMAVLLHSRAFTVMFATDQPDGPTLARSRAETIVIDADGSVAVAQRAAEEAGLRRSGRTVIFVSDDAEALGGPSGVVPKWSSLERLCDEIATGGPSAQGPETPGSAANSRALGSER